jgi:hypothetical protein
MGGGQSVRRRWTAVLSRLAVAAGIGGLTVISAGAAAAPTAAAPVIQMQPAHLLGTDRTTARSSAAAATPSPCWASSNWSGYAVSQTSPSGLPCVPASGQTYTSVTATWIVPTVTGSRTSTYSSAWAGIDGFTNSNLIQAGTEQDYVGGHAHYSAWWEILPAPETVIPSITVQPGDSITVSIAKVSSSQWSITLTDQGKAGHAAQPSFTTTQNYTGTGTSAEWILEAPQVNGRIATLAQYGSTSFDSGTTNGLNPALVAGTGGEMVQGSFARQHIVSTPSSPDTGAPAGDGFAVAYGSVAPPPPAS